MTSNYVRRIIIVILAGALGAAGTALGADAPGRVLTSEVRLHNGVPALYVNGTLTSQILAAPYRQGPEDFEDFTKAGISMFDIYLLFDWKGPEEYDFKAVDRKMDEYLSLKPDALFIARVLLTPGDWWCSAFPKEITMRDDGSPAGMFGARCHPSLASAQYRELSHRAMIAFIHHVEDKYGKNVVGYQVGNGFGGEWLMFNSFWEIRPGQQPPTKFGVEDYSPPARAAFRAWLRDKYHTNGALQGAWRDDKVTLENAEPPGERERYTTTRGIFFDPAVSMRAPDYFSFFNEMVSNVLLENAAWVKELIHRKKVVGAFYGYLWCNFPNLSVVHTGHLGLARVLNSADIDFIASPYTYDNKEIGGPDNSQTLPAEIQLHGKLYFNEVDTETYLHQRQWRWGNSLNNPTNFRETQALLVRDYAYALTNGFGMWWTDLFGGTFHDDKIINLLAKLKDLDNRTLNVNRRSSAEIAVVLDESSFTYFGDGEPLLSALLTAQKQWELAFIGAPWDPLLLTDMGNPRLRTYKLYIFLNTFHVTPEQREAIHSRLERNGATALWVYAPGYIGARADIANIEKLTGIHVEEADSAGELHVNITATNSAYTDGLPEAMSYGTDVRVADIRRWYDHQLYLKDPRDPTLRRDLPGFRVVPRFWINDDGAQVLGLLADLKEPGLAVKRVSNWTSIYSSAPIVPASLLRNIARTAGCHIYSDGGDVVYAGGEFLGVYSPQGGRRTFYLPRRSNIIDLLANRIVARDVDQFDETLELNTTLLLQINTASVP
jgi:hypothetical protein